MRSYFRRADPFFDEQENHSLIGVANVFLSCLFYDVKLQYAVPIINQKGEVGGHGLANIAGSFKDYFCFLLKISLFKCRRFVPHSKLFHLSCACVQVAGRLHVEVVRIGGGLEDNMAGGDETDNNQDADFEDRKLVCMVSGVLLAIGKSSEGRMQIAAAFKGVWRCSRKLEDV